MRSLQTAFLWSIAFAAVWTACAAATSAQQSTPLAGGASLHELFVEGELRDVRAAPDGRVLLLTDQALTAWRIGEQAVVLLDEPPDAAQTMIFFDLDGDGADELLLGAPSRLYSLELDSETPVEPSLILESRGLDLDEMERRGLLHPEGREFAVVDLDLLRRFAWRDGAFQEEGAFDLPLLAAREPTGIVLSSPPVSGLWPSSDAGGVDPLFLAGPDAQGSYRLRTIVVDEGAAGTAQDAEAEEAESENNAERWSRFRGPERIEQSWYRLHNGEPILIVATRRADKMGVFEKQKLRVFRLRGDRTRAGVGPSLEHETKSIWWYPLRIEISDIDGDGHEDLSVLQSDGLGGGKLVATVFRGQSTGGRFETLELESSLKVRGSVAWGDDLDGDGKPDLLVRDGRDLRLYPGVIHLKKRRLFEKKPAWELSLPSGPLGDDEQKRVRMGRPRTVDLDGDGRVEVLLRGVVYAEAEGEDEDEKRAGSVLRILQWTPKN